MQNRNNMMYIARIIIRMKPPKDQEICRNNPGQGLEVEEIIQLIQLNTFWAAEMSLQLTAPITKSQA